MAWKGSGVRVPSAPRNTPRSSREPPAARPVASARWSSASSELSRSSDGDREIPVPGLRLRTLLALLIVADGATVHPDRLADDLWGEAIPAGAANALQSLVSKLRRTLGDGGDLVVTDAPGLPPRDRRRTPSTPAASSAALADGQAALAAGDAATAAARARRRARAVWRGPGARRPRRRRRAAARGAAAGGAARRPRSRSGATPISRAAATPRSSPSCSSSPWPTRCASGSTAS